VCALALLGAVTKVQASGPTLLFDVETGHVLYAEQPDQKWHPASLTKIMTAYIAFEALKAGRLKPDQKLVTSERAHKMPPSKIGLPVGAEMSLELGLRSLIIKSANDVSVMIAEAIDGSVEAFAARMNRTASRLGMENTRFVNPNGLPDRLQITSARDLAKLTRAVLSEYPEHAHYWATPTMRIGKIRLRSHNTLLRSYAGADGVKTGFICDSGFNIVASAKRDGRHLAAVVLGESTPIDRAARAGDLLTHGFETYAWKRLLNAPTLASLPRNGDGIPAPSIRDRIKVWDCRGPRAPASRPGSGIQTSKKQPPRAEAKTPPQPLRAQIRPSTPSNLHREVFNQR
jgi:D-alanyl-D-alanine carboxypeptidase